MKSLYVVTCKRLKRVYLTNTSNQLLKTTNTVRKEHDFSASFSTPPSTSSGKSRRSVSSFEICQMPRRECRQKYAADVILELYLWKIYKYWVYSIRVVLVFHYADGSKNTPLRFKTEVAWRHVNRAYCTGCKTVAHR